ncbi:hypothetical protein ACHAXT_013124 [Thalassiosira profunda]
MAEHAAAGARAFPTRRAPHTHDTDTTDAQSATEEECAPFFVDLPSLSEGQLDHLRHVGLLPPLPTADGSGEGSGELGGLEGKAAKLLGVNEGPRIELLEGASDGDGSPPIKCNSGGSPPINSDGKPFDPYAIRLVRAAHTSYLTNALCNPLKRGFVSLDASHPWMVYWCLHSLDLLGYFDEETNGDGDGLADGALRDVEELQKAHLLERVVSTLRHCWTDVPLEFAAEEVETDARLQQLQKDQRKTGSTPSTEVDKVSITGGGYGGGPQQMPHCAPIYAGVLALSIVAGLGSGRPDSHPYRKAGSQALEELTRRRLQLYAFFLTLREQEGQGDELRTAFRMQHDGEIDVRAGYCLLAPCYLLGLLEQDGNDHNPLRCPSIARSIASCQTFEGGFGAEPYNEAHGGYTFCALAALRILDSVSVIDVEALSSWLARRQMGYEGGFCGRTNKLVDGCYSFWQGGAVAVLDGWLHATQHEAAEELDAETPNELSFDEVMLQRYILLCAQDVNGGLRDKPSKPKDFYHSCYNLSGLSVAQHAVRQWPPSANDDGDVAAEDETAELNCIFGDVGVNIVGRTDPVANIRVERVKFMRAQRF